jgi:aldehyde dehydrogenase (NAD+)
MYPKKILHWINDREVNSSSGDYFDKIDPATGKIIAQVTHGNKKDVDKAINIAVETFEEWSNNSVVNRADILRKAIILMQEKKSEIAETVSSETGKSIKDALGEVGGAIELGFFMAGEGRRFYGKTTTSAVANRYAMTFRQPVGVCGLIVPFNTPIANVAWKTFPALLCGNTAVLKAAKDTPYTPIWFAKILKDAGLPAGVFNVIEGYGEEVGIDLVKDERIHLVSFTGSVTAGRLIQQLAGERLAKVSLELGGKNALVVCDDADLEKASDFAVLSAFSNAGQRCASASRIIIFNKVYDNFKKLMLGKTKRLKLGKADSDNLGPVINELQMNKILEMINQSVERDKTKNLIGGYRLTDTNHRNGFYIAPTIIENISSHTAISREELFGPVTCFYRVKDFNEAVDLANDSPYGLTAAIHTSSIHRAQEFIKRCKVGVVSVNGPTYGSEPHLPFGGLKNSGNGFREPGTEALDVYSEIKTVYIKYDPEKI